MHGMHDDPNVTTVYLGQFTREHANTIAGELEEHHITWWYKEPGFFSQIWSTASACSWTVSISMKPRRSPRARSLSAARETSADR